MRNNYFSKTVIVALMSGLIAGIVSAFFHTEQTTDIYGAWIPIFYQCNSFEIFIKSAFLTEFFIFAVLISGLFIFGYLLILPINYFYGYTVGFVITCALICFGAYAIPFVCLKLPTFAVTMLFLHKISSLATAFSSNILTDSPKEDLRKKTGNYLCIGFLYCIITTAPFVYDSVLVPKILNLWDSF